MQMKPEDFGELRRLLAVKRYEVPPPGYFHRFPDKVIARIEAQQLHEVRFTWRRWFADLLARPVVSGACVMLFGGAAIGAIGLFQTQITGLETPSASIWAAPVASDPLAPQPSVHPVAHAAILPSSVSPVVGALDTPFRYYGLRAETVAFQAR
jgi:hypothetical protein